MRAYIRREIGQAYTGRGIYVSNRLGLRGFTETRLEDADRTKTLPCKYFFKMERRNPSQELRVNYANREYIVTCFDCSHLEYVTVIWQMQKFLYNVTVQFLL